MQRTWLRTYLALQGCLEPVLKSVWLCWPQTVQRVRQDVQCRLSELGATARVDRFGNWQEWALGKNLVLCSLQGQVTVSTDGTVFTADGQYFRAPFGLRMRRRVSCAQWWPDLEQALAKCMH